MTHQHPKDWQVLPLGLIAKLRLGGNYPNGPTPTRRPLIKMGNIARVTIDLSRVDYIPNSERVLPEHRLRYGDVLFNTRNTLDLVGKVSTWRDELPCAYYNSNILRLEFKEEYCANSLYFGYALNTRSAIDAIRTLATGTTSVAAVYTRDLLNLQVVVPPKWEQERLASALTAADDVIVTLDRLIAKKAAIKHGALQQLLTGSTRLPGFDGEWEVKTLGEISAFRAGEYVRQEEYQAGGEHFVYGSNSIMGKYGRALVSRPHVVMAAVGAYAGAVRYSGRPSWINNNAFAIIPNKNTDPFFVYCWLRTRLELEAVVAGTGQPYVRKPILKQQTVKVPCLDEQRAIARVFAELARIVHEAEAAPMVGAA